MKRKIVNAAGFIQIYKHNQIFYKNLNGKLLTHFLNLNIDILFQDFNVKITQRNATICCPTPTNTLNHLILNCCVHFKVT